MKKQYLLGLYEKAMPLSITWEERFICAKSFGFDYLEMSIDETDERLKRLEMTKCDREKIVMLMKKHDVKIKSICLSAHRKYPLGSKDYSTQKKSIDIMEKALKLASDLGVSIIQLAGYDVYYETSNSKTKRNFIKNLKICCELAKLYGVKLGFETMETPFMDTVTKAMEYVAMMQTDCLGVYPDIGNLKNASLVHGNSLVEDIKAGKNNIMAVHLKETTPGVYREVPFGTGHTDYDACIPILKEQGVRLFVAEFWHTGKIDWKKDCTDAALFLRSKLDKFFI